MSSVPRPTHTDLQFPTQRASPSPCPQEQLQCTRVRAAERVCRQVDECAGRAGVPVCARARVRLRVSTCVSRVRHRGPVLVQRSPGDGLFARKPFAEHLPSAEQEALASGGEKLEEAPDPGAGMPGAAESRGGLSSRRSDSHWGLRAQLSLGCWADSVTWTAWCWACLVETRQMALLLGS